MVHDNAGLRKLNKGDGKLGAHIGYKPIFEKEPNFKKSALENVRRLGSRAYHAGLRGL
jgi:hypothetical protein